MKKFIHMFFFVFIGSMIPLLASNPPATPEIPPTATIPQDFTMPPTPSYEYAFFKMLISLVLLLGLIILTAWAIKRLTQNRLKFMNQTLAIKILEKRALSPKSLLYLVEVEGKKILIAESQLEVRLLTSCEKEKEEALS